MTRPNPRASIRLATTDDVDALFKVRTAVRENALTTSELHERGITPASIADTIRSAPCAWVASVEDQVVGFAMVDLDDACLFAAFVLPQYEGCGIGTQLIQICETALFERHPIAWLETAQTSRAAGLYRHLGWGNETLMGDGDIRLEKRRATCAVPL